MLGPPLNGYGYSIPIQGNMDYMADPEGDEGHGDRYDGEDAGRDDPQSSSSSEREEESEGSGGSESPEESDADEVLSEDSDSGQSGGEGEGMLMPAGLAEAPAAPPTGQPSARLSSQREAAIRNTCRAKFWPLTDAVPSGDLTELTRVTVGRTIGGSAEVKALKPVLHDALQSNAGKVRDALSKTRSKTAAGRGGRSDGSPIVALDQRLGHLAKSVVPEAFVGATVTQILAPALNEDLLCRMDSSTRTCGVGWVASMMLTVDRSPELWRW
ncbi:hypothetical protein PLESTB_000849300 [Pleodorina starrii]|uniref:Uncharacterized protein n=1 Tax=Pleodorina starrii TaxID=330485 RepID=A0A9W6BMY2_9CHLO|nr:hypothetical protein PLESTB_000849300 [Pleodorina starrii]